MKLSKSLAILLAAALLLTACGTPKNDPTEAPEAPSYTDATRIVLDDGGITVDGAPAGTQTGDPVYTAKDIVYYEAGKDFTYGEGSEEDAHTPEEAAAHTVVHITQPGTYELSGKLSLGQIAVDLGSDAKKDPEAVVTLVLSGVDITCRVAPAVIFYNVYECGDDNATKDVDTSAAGANVIIADGTVNTVNGAYVAKIYEPESVVLSDDRTQVEDADKLHKYDGAFYSKRSMNVFGGEENTGSLNINAENEGLDSEMHLTVNGGNISIVSGNDGINTNEDGLSVTTVNGGRVEIRVDGRTGEGDGIDSNGWLVINGGTVIAAACSDSADAGIDSDMGIHINGGTVIATGHMLDRIEDGGQTYGVFNFAQKQTGSETVALTDADGNTLLQTQPENAYSVLIFSSPDLQPGTYTLTSDGTTLAGSASGMMGGFMQPGGTERPQRPDDMDGGQPSEGERPEMPEDFTMPEGEEPPKGFTRPEGERPEMPEDFTMPEGEEPPEGFTRPEGERPEMPEDFTMPEGQEPPEDFTMPEGQEPPEMPGGQFRPGGEQEAGQQTAEFVIREGGNMFGGISALTEV